MVARFEAERQALAVMDHPAIAHVFDAGATPNGRPYFAMEYVRGEAITEYCTRHRLGRFGVTTAAAVATLHPDTFYSMNILLAIYIRQERYAEAEPIARALLQGQRRVLGEEHPDTLTNMHNLARLYDGLQRPREAERIYLETIRSRRRVLGDLHPTTILSVSRLAALYQKEGRYADAEALLLPLTTVPGGASGKLSRVWIWTPSSNWSICTTPGRSPPNPLSGARSWSAAPGAARRLGSRLGLTTKPPGTIERETRATSRARTGGTCPPRCTTPRCRRAG